MQAFLQQFKGGSSSVSLTPLEDKSLIAFQGVLIHVLGHVHVHYGRVEKMRRNVAV